MEYLVEVGYLIFTVITHEEEEATLVGTEAVFEERADTFV